MRKEDYIRKQLQKGIRPTELDIEPYIPSTHRGGSLYESRPFAIVSKDGKYAYNGVEILKNQEVVKRIILKKRPKGIIRLNEHALNILTCHCNISKVKGVDYYEEMLLVNHMLYRIPEDEINKGDRYL